MKDESRQGIQGAFFTEELQKVKYPDVYLVEKVLRKKGDKIFVKWLGLSKAHNSWINRSNIAWFVLIFKVENHI